MAGIYPVGMKPAAGWAKGDLGLLIGLVVGALTVGSAAPHAMPAALGAFDWRAVCLAAGAVAALGGLPILPFRPAPLEAKRLPFRPSQALEAGWDKRLRLADLGHLGRMWELYAMRAWAGCFPAPPRLAPPRPASPRSAAPGGPAPGVLTALVVASGAAGCVALGLLADRLNRARMAAAAMLASGVCALPIGPASAVSLALALAAVRGVTVVADSAPFSACTALCSPPEYVGTMPTVQTCAGFLLTAPVIQLMAWAVPALGVELREPGRRPASGRGRDAAARAPAADAFAGCVRMGSRRLPSLCPFAGLSVFGDSVSTHPPLARMFLTTAASSASH